MEEATIDPKTKCPPSSLFVPSYHCTPKGMGGRGEVTGNAKYKLISY